MAEIEFDDEGIDSGRICMDSDRVCTGSTADVRTLLTGAEGVHEDLIHPIRGS